MTYGSMQKKIVPHFVISDIDVWHASGIEKGRDIVIEQGRIKSITPHGRQNYPGPIIAGSGKALLPGGVDPQVHMRVPGQPQKESPTSGCAAAIRGGITALLTMPNTNPVIDNVDVVALTRKEIEQATADTGVKIELSAAITMGQKGQKAVDFYALAKAGIAAYTDDGVGVLSDDLMRAVFAASADTGLPVLQHAEWPGHGGILAPGPMQTRLRIKAYPPEAESRMVARDLKLLQEFPAARYHVLHVSSVQTLELVAAAKDRGLNVTCEVSPHHLLFTSDDVHPANPAFKMNPPLRSSSDRSALVTALREGLCEFVATDHAPHEAEIKTEDLKTAAYGTTGLETALRVLLTLHHRGEISSQRLVEVFSTKPAAFLGLSDTEGAIASGRELRAVLVDPKAMAAPITARDLASKSSNNCFLGTHLNGQIAAVLVGERVFQ